MSPGAEKYVDRARVRFFQRVSILVVLALCLGRARRLGDSWKRCSSFSVEKHHPYVAQSWRADSLPSARHFQRYENHLYSGSSELVGPFAESSVGTLLARFNRYQKYKQEL